MALTCLADCSPASTLGGCAMQPFMGIGVVVEKGKVASGCETWSVKSDQGYFDAAIEGITTTEQAVTGGNPGQVALGQQVASSKPAEGNTKKDQDKEEDQNSQQKPGQRSVSDRPRASEHGLHAAWRVAVGRARYLDLRSVPDRSEWRQLYLLARGQHRGGQPNKALEAFIFFRQPLLGHQRVGSFQLDSNGNGTFSGSITRQGRPPTSTPRRTPRHDGRRPDRGSDRGPCLHHVQHPALHGLDQETAPQSF